jgi:spore germination protein GerM
MTPRLAWLARGKRKRWLQAAAVVVIFGVAAWGASQLLERMVSPVQQQPQSAPAPAAPAAAVPHIIATLYYGTSDGQALAAVKREVPLGEGPRAQGQQILQSELEPAAPPYVSLIPAGTTLRAFYITDRGDAFVDFSPEISRNHPGGSTNELLTVYAIVNVVTANLSSVERVQILIDGKQADTLAGHVDLRRPFERDTSLVKESKGTR